MKHFRSVWSIEGSVLKFTLFPLFPKGVKLYHPKGEKEKGDFLGSIVRRYNLFGPKQLIMKVSKSMSNLEIAELLRAVAASYQLKDEEKNKFRIIAYQKAADAVEHASSELKDLWDEGKLDEVPSVGKSIGKHLGEIFRRGRSEHFEEVMKGLPNQMFELMAIPGIGAKTAYKLATELKISKKDSVGSLEKLAKKGKIAQLQGFGKDSEKDILESIAGVKVMVKRHLLPYALQLANDITDWLYGNKLVLRADPLGSLRRRTSTVGDIDIGVSSNNPEAVLEHFIHFPKAQRVLEKGERTASIVVPGNIQVDVMV